VAQGSYLISPLQAMRPNHLVLPTSVTPREVNVVGPFWRHGTF
jgi:hypothetical protein